MELSFREIRQKTVVCTDTGACLGRICDIKFTAEGAVLGFTIPGKGWHGKNDLFLPLPCVKKFGEDVVLVRLPSEKKRETPCLPLCPQPCGGEEEDG